MIWRDDDIGVRTSVHDLGAVDDILRAAGVAHTIAVMARGMDTRPDLVEFIRSRNMVVELHCWDHDDLTESAAAREQLEAAAAMIERLFGRRPEVLFPTWNRSSPDLEAAAKALGLRVSFRKVSLEQYIRCAGDVAESVCNFHYWHPGDVALLPAALAARAKP